MLRRLAFLAIVVVVSATVPACAGPHKFLNDATLACSRIPNDDTKLSTLKELCDLKVKAGLYKDAAETFQNLCDVEEHKKQSGFKNSTLRLLVQEAAAQGNIEWGKTLVVQKSAIEISIANSEIARAYAKVNDIPAANRALENVRIQTERIYASISIAAAKHRTGRKDEARALFAALLGDIRNLFLKELMDECLRCLVFEQAKAGDIDEAIRTCNSVENSEDRADLLSLVGMCLDNTKAQELARGILTLSTVGRCDGVDWARQLQVGMLCERGELEKARESLEQITRGSSYRLAAVSEISKCYLATGRTKFAYDACRYAGTTHHELQAKRELVRLLINEGKSREAAWLVGTLAEEVEELGAAWHADGYLQLVYGYCDLKQWKVAAFYAVRIDPKSGNRTTAIREVAKRWASEGKRSEMQRWFSSLGAPVDIASANMGAAEGLLFDSRPAVHHGLDETQIRVSPLTRLKQDVSW